MEWIRDAVKTSEGRKLSLLVEKWDGDAGVWKKSSEEQQKHLRCLWGMTREQRMQELWVVVQPDLRMHVRELEVGGEWCPASCPMHDQEMAALFPLGSLGCLEHLFLHCLSSLSDDGMRILANAGCGTQLTSLTLSRLKQLTDHGLCALAETGCGPMLTSLSLWSLTEGVTDAGIHALTDRGCGAKLTSLTLWGLQKGVSDHGLCSLARAGCGPKLTSLVLTCTSWWRCPGY